MATLYETLGVDEHATEDEIKRAYRKAAMRCHPDRNAGNEDAARARFQEVKEAYAILSDPAQREVYDRTFAEEIARWEARMREEEAEREALYAKRVSLAMRFAAQGHNRDVVFGVLLGQDCDEETARRIAESVVALHESRQAPVQPDTEDKEPAEKTAENAKADETNAANPLGAMWFQFFNNLRL
ncbi:Heat shock protein DnaJ domain protein [Burkholderia sp. 8Y]|uniref:J domain-containing protein n=1 Tax=Burkholderia sp. 8Y TaxID=2653133 RepID=UPI0012EF4383|nr:DnaJ domain-containing protein [Burkholderia sp. 8Y]VXC87214.1 Heat shock protein DnaJ domain protein [Burkholderia sp. 8Y]